MNPFLSSGSLLLWLKGVEAVVDLVPSSCKFLWVNCCAYNPWVWNPWDPALSKGLEPHGLSAEEGENVLLVQEQEVRPPDLFTPTLDSEPSCQCRVTRNVGGSGTGMNHRKTAEILSLRPSNKCMIWKSASSFSLYLGGLNKLQCAGVKNQDPQPSSHQRMSAVPSTSPNLERHGCLYGLEN